MSVGPIPRSRLRLKEGVRPDRAIAVLDERITALNNLPGRACAHSRSLDYIMERRDHYIEWVEDGEIALGELTYDNAVADLLHTARFWALRQVVPTDARPIPLIDGEIRSRRDTLERLKSDLMLRVQRATIAPGHVTVLDTNTLLHHEPPQSVPWATVVGYSSVRLVIPLRVIEELDAKKYSDSRRQRDRARAVLPHLSERIGRLNEPAQLSEGVTLEMLAESGPRDKPADADEEILDTCRELWEFSSQQGGVTLITNDMSMRSRAEAIGGIRPIGLDDRYRRDKDLPDEPSQQEE
jgi:rRNA-processing protein FCF1